MSFYVRAHKGSTLSQWSLGNGTPVTSKGGGLLCLLLPRTPGFRVAVLDRSAGGNFLGQAPRWP